MKTGNGKRKKMEGRRLWERQTKKIDKERRDTVVNRKSRRR